MFKQNRNVTKKKFFQILNPVQTWALNNKNPLFEGLSCSFNFEGEQTHFHLTVFFSKYDAVESSNETLDLYCWQSEETLTYKKTVFKEILKSKNKDEFKKARLKFEMKVRD